MFYTSTQVCDKLGLQYRVLDYWCRNHAIKPTIPAQGTGSKREFSQAEVDRLALIVPFYTCLPQLFNIAFVTEVWDETTVFRVFDTHRELETASGIALSVPV